MAFCPAGAELTGEPRVCPEGISFEPVHPQGGETPRPGLEDLVSLVLPMAWLSTAKAASSWEPRLARLSLPQRRPVTSSATRAPAQVRRERCEGRPCGWRVAHSLAGGEPGFPG